jgi:hypothetical protein
VEVISARASVVLTALESKRLQRGLLNFAQVTSLDTVANIGKTSHAIQLPTPDGNK